MKRKVAVVILTWNKKDLVLECLESIYKCESRHKVEYIVVDNNSKDNTVKEIRNKFPKTIILKNPSNLGWTGGNNRGIRYALKQKADCVILLSNDLIVKKNFIDHLVDPLFDNEQLGITGPKILDKSNKKIIKSAGFKFDKRFRGISLNAGKKDSPAFSKNKTVEMVSGACLGIKTDVFKKVGLLDDKFFIYFEEADFCMRTRNNGFLILYVPGSVIYHTEAATTGFNSPFHTYYNTRNHLLFIEKYGKIKDVIIETYRSLRLGVSKLARGKNDAKYIFLGINDYYFRKFGKKEYW